jgi:hypothetical protein
MGPEDAAVFVAVYRSCKDPLLQATAPQESSSSTSVSDDEAAAAAAADIVSSRKAAAGLGMSAWGARVVLECLPAASFCRMALTNCAWRRLVRRQAVASVRREEVYTAQLAAATAARDAVAVAKLLRSAPAALANPNREASAASQAATAVAAAREAQRTWALESQAAVDVARAVANGVPDAAAAAALAEAVALGMGRGHGPWSESVAQLEALLGAQGASEAHRSRGAGWRNKAKAHGAVYTPKWGVL